MSVLTYPDDDIVELARAWASIGGHDDTPGAAVISRDVTESFLARSEPDDLDRRMRLLVRLAGALLDLDRYDGVEILESIVRWGPNAAGDRATPPTPDQMETVSPVIQARILLAKYNAERVIGGDTYLASKALEELDAIELDLSHMQGTAGRLASAEVSYIRAYTHAVLGDTRAAVSEFTASAKRVADMHSPAADSLRIRALAPAELLRDVEIPVDAAPPDEMQRDLDRVRWRARRTGLTYMAAYNISTAALGAAITAAGRRRRVGLIVGAAGARGAARLLRRPTQQYATIRAQHESEFESARSAAARQHFRARRIVCDSIILGKPFVLLLRNFELTRVTRRSRYEEPFALGRYVHVLQRRRLLPRSRGGASMFAANVQRNGPMEADLVEALTRYVPVVQIANAGDYSRDITVFDWIAERGESSAASLHIGNDDWEEVVRGLVRVAHFIVVWLGMESSGVGRELEIIRAEGRRQATVVVRVNSPSLDEARQVREVLGDLTGVDTGAAPEAPNAAELSGFRHIESSDVMLARLDEDPTFGDLVRDAVTRASMPLIDRLSDRSPDAERISNPDPVRPPRTA